jgi:hypothetical protein
MIKKAEILAALYVVLGLCTATSARTITVDDDGPADFSNIQAAMDDANNGDTVIVADGIYTGEGNRNIDAGTGGVSNIIVRSENGPENCIIDGEGATYGFIFDGMMYSHDLPIILLEGFTITNCKYGVDLHQTGTRPTIKNCIITGNSSIGIYCMEGSDVAIIDCEITNNGTGINCWMMASPRITNCIISGNTSSYWGGGFYISIDSEPEIYNSIIAGNKAPSGGGLYITLNSNLNIVNCTISGNTAASGGRLYITKSSNLNILNCTISGNTAVSGGGFACVEESDTQVRNGIIWNNTADEGPDVYRGQGRADRGYAIIDFTVLQSHDLQGEGAGNIIADPCFAKTGYWDVNGTPANANDDFWIEGDYHLKSQAGRWNSNSES